MPSAPIIQGRPGVVYLLHFREPYEHARHYLGWAANLDQRLATHAAGRGSPLLAACQRRGITWTLARTWAPADRYFERKLKRWHKSSQLCPLCGGQTPRDVKPPRDVKL